MSRAESLHIATSSREIPDRRWRVASLSLALVSIVLFAAVLRTNFQSQESSSLPLIVAAVILALSVVIFLHTRFLLQIRELQRNTMSELQGTEHEIRCTQKQLAANRTLAQSAYAEAEALRKTTFTLTQDVQMGILLETLLESLAELVPYGSARVLLLEDESRLFVAHEKSFLETKATAPPYPATFDLIHFTLLKRILKDKNSVLLEDTLLEPRWRSLPCSADVRSWLGVPLVSAEQTLGILCADHSHPNAFTPGHLRLAKSLAVSATAAIQNARLYEQAEIYALELEKRLSDLRDTQEALEQAEELRQVSEEKFQKIFRSSPVAFSITTLEQGRFLEVNNAFELRYGYSRSELIGRTVQELRFWEDLSDRAFMITQLRKGAAIRNVVTRLRSKSGELKLTGYSADIFEFDEQVCVLAVSSDLPQPELGSTN